MQLRTDKAFKFDRFFPIYNWIYPASVFRTEDSSDVQSAMAGVTGIKSRALYFHIPFCETICTFCPFVRGTTYSPETVGQYVDALVSEVNIFAPLLQDVPIAAIFFGGGTPSFLSPEQIEEIGRAIRENFDLSNLQEFSFEFEVKSAHRDTISAAQSIGVTHARFGLQTFSERYRKMFNLTASIDDVVRAASDMKAVFPYVSSDMIFGMHNQSPDELISDLESWLNLGLQNLDYYPINNVSIQKKLVDNYRYLELQATAGEDKFYLNQMARAWLSEHGFMPHNGHGYVYEGSTAANNEVPITRSYSFRYHEHVYGYDDHDLFGFGVNAISSTRGLRIQNPTSLKTYITGLKEGVHEAAISRHGPGLDAARPVALKLPYAGFIARDRVDWGAMPKDTAQRLEEALQAGLATENQTEIVLTRDGWNNYSNLMFYLSPASERKSLQAVATQAARRRARDIGDLRAPDLRRA